MLETSFVIKYDGDSDDLRKHQIDAKALSAVLSNISDLIQEANEVINGGESEIDVKAKAGFVEGSFGIEFVLLQEAINACKDVLPYLGFTAAAASGSLLSILRNIKAREVEDIVVNDDGTVDLVVEGESIPTSPEIAKLVNSPRIRKSIDAVVHLPLTHTGSSVFQVMNPLNLNESFIAINKEEKAAFKVPPLARFSQIETTETVAVIEFLQANKESISTGWKIRHLGEDSPVRLKDETFFEKIKKPDAPSIFGLKFKVDLKVKTMTRENQPSKKTLTIDKIISIAAD